MGVSKLRYTLPTLSLLNNLETFKFNFDSSETTEFVETKTNYTTPSNHHTIHILLGEINMIAFSVLIKEVF